MEEETRGTSNMSTCPIKLNVLKEHGKARFQEMLEGIQGTKALILDKKLIPSLQMIFDIAALKEAGVEKLLYLEPVQMPTEYPTYVYLVQPKVPSMHIVADQILSIQKSNKGYKNFYIYFVPRRTMLCERALEERNVYNSCIINEFQLDLLPFEEDVLSLELPRSFRECFLDRDRTALFYVARSLMKLQSIFGVIGNIKGKGSCARSVADMMLRMKKELSIEDESRVPEIDNLILIDRTVDMVTPMCVQLTYEGLIDELFGINYGEVMMEGSIVKKEAGKKHNFPLNYTDTIFHEIRNLHFSLLGGYVSQKAKEIKLFEDKRHEQTTLGQIREYVKKLSIYQVEKTSLVIHTSIAQLIVAETKKPEFRNLLKAQHEMVNGEELGLDYIEECINRQEDIFKVFRLLVLHSITGNGLKAKAYQFFKREILQTYGNEYLFTFNNLEKLHLLTEQNNRNFAALRKTFSLYSKDEATSNNFNPKDIASGYGGICPMSVRMIQKSAKPGGWNQMEEVLRQCPGPLFEETQVIPEGVRQLAIDRSQGTRNNVTLIFFIGGITFAEISLIRQLHALDHRDFIIATTKFINGKSLLKTLIEPIGKAAATAAE